ncbi:MAG: glycosyltransferase family 2 protein, partial [Aurantibacter sp.]
MENMPKNPKVSILVCTYNRARILAEALDSVLNQTYKNFELVIIDNGSTDETPKVLEAYQQDERVRIFTLPVNRGCAGGYNYGFDQLRGEWFGIIGDDDLLTEDAIETLMHIPEALDPEVNAVSANSIFKSNGEFAAGGVDKDQYLDFET